MQKVLDRATARKPSEAPPAAPLLELERALAGLAAALAPALAPLLVEHLGDREPARYLDDASLARRLDCGLALVRQLAAEGAPHVHVGDRRRWLATDVDQWLRERAARQR